MSKFVYTTIKVTLVMGILLFSMPALYAAHGHADHTYHFGYVSGGAGYSTFAQKIEGTKVTGSYALFGGVGYELRVKGFFTNIGVQYMNERVGIKVNEYKTGYYPGIDNTREPDSVKFFYMINQKDQYHWQTIDFPLQVGYYYKGAYVGVGVKYSMLFGSKKMVEGTVSGTYELAGKYKNGTIVRQKDIYQTYEINSRNSYVVKPQFSLIAEAGYDVLALVENRSSFCNILKIGCYFEYGFSNMFPTYGEGEKPVDACVFKTDVAGGKDPRKLDVNPYLMTKDWTGKKATPLCIGIKLTYMIGGNSQNSGTKSTGCPCYRW